MTFKNHLKISKCEQQKKEKKYKYKMMKRDRKKRRTPTKTVRKIHTPKVIDTKSDIKDICLLPVRQITSTS